MLYCYICDCTARLQKEKEKEKEERRKRVLCFIFYLYTSFTPTVLLCVYFVVIYPLLYIVLYVYALYIHIYYSLTHYCCTLCTFRGNLSTVIYCTLCLCTLYPHLRGRGVTRFKQQSESGIRFSCILLDVAVLLLSILEFSHLINIAIPLLLLLFKKILA